MTLNQEIKTFLEDGKHATISEIACVVKANRQWVQSSLRTMALQGELTRHERRPGIRNKIEYSLPQQTVVEVS